MQLAEVKQSQWNEAVTEQIDPSGEQRLSRLAVEKIAADFFDEFVSAWESRRPTETPQEVTRRFGELFEAFIDRYCNDFKITGMDIRLDRFCPVYRVTCKVGSDEIIKSISHTYDSSIFNGKREIINIVSSQKSHFNEVKVQLEKKANAYFPTRQKSCEFLDFIYASSHYMRFHKGGVEKLAEFDLKATIEGMGSIIKGLDQEVLSIAGGLFKVLSPATLGVTHRNLCLAQTIKEGGAAAAADFVVSQQAPGYSVPEHLKGALRSKSARYILSLFDECVELFDQGAPGRERKSILPANVNIVPIIEALNDCLSQTGEIPSESVLHATRYYQRNIEESQKRGVLGAIFAATTELSIDKPRQYTPTRIAKAIGSVYCAMTNHAHIRELLRREIGKQTERAYAPAKTDACHLVGRIVMHDEAAIAVINASVRDGKIYLAPDSPVSGAFKNDINKILEVVRAKISKQPASIIHMLPSVNSLRAYMETPQGKRRTTVVDGVLYLDQTLARSAIKAAIKSGDAVFFNEVIERTHPNMRRKLIDEEDPHGFIDGKNGTFAAIIAAHNLSSIKVLAAAISRCDKSASLLLAEKTTANDEESIRSLVDAAKKAMPDNQVLAAIDSIVLNYRASALDDKEESQAALVPRRRSMI